VKLSSSLPHISLLSSGSFSSPNNFLLHRDEPFIIGVSGGTASGKTTVCHKIVSMLKSKRVCIISLDSFYRTLSSYGPDADPKNIDYDHPMAFDWNLLKEILKKIRRQIPVDIPKYDFVTHSR
jgi:uridine kinase